MTRITTPVSKDELMRLNAGDQVYINGILYAARDAAHKKMAEIIEEGGKLPFDPKGQIIYYVGPCPAKEGQAIGSAGPTTSGRMDIYTPELIYLGLAGMIGKGERSKEVKEAAKKNGCVYFGAVGGLGALISKKIVSQEVIAFPELGTESLRKLVVNDFPATVILDLHGENLYEKGRRKYCICN